MNTRRTSGGTTRGFAFAASVLAACALSSCAEADEAPAPQPGRTEPRSKGPAPVYEDGIALAIVYDTSGSMKDPVPDGAGGRAPKFAIGNRALDAIVARLEKFRDAQPVDARKPIETALVRFRGKTAAAEIPLRAFDPAALRRFAQAFDSPDGPTPLGLALRVAGDAVLASKLVTKHVLVVTDGQNTEGPDPASVFRQLAKRAEVRETAIAVHFVAFDVDADVFRGVHAEGATVVSAADEQQLNEKLEYILEEKILLEVDRSAGGSPSKR